MNYNAIKTFLQGKISYPLSKITRCNYYNIDNEIITKKQVNYDKI